jgi:hypothetical protein
MRSGLICGLIIGIVGLSNAHAQSIEESYANLCSDKTVAKSETCVALRQALIAKLQGQEAGSSPTRSALKTGALPGSDSSSMPSAAAPAATPAEPAVNAETLALWHKRWGHYADMVGKTWEQGGAAAGYLTTYRWKTPGEELESTTVSPDQKTTVTLVLRWDEARQCVVSNFSGFESYLVAKPDGSVESAGKPGSPTARYRGVSRMRADGALESESYELKDGEWKLILRGLSAIHRPGVAPPTLEGPPTELEQQLADNQRKTAELQKQLPSGSELDAMQARNQAYEEQRAAAKSKRGKVFGTLLVAGVGATAASKFGGNTEQIVGGALKGAQIANADNSVGAALGSTADTMLTSGATPSGGTTNANGPGAVSPGSYPTQPNLATGSCAGFTEANYRERAVSGGGDQQLYAMCGQAFEYYTMYKRAIAQGYSQADAERTYSAHRDSAAVASSYLSSHGAN